MPLTRRNFLVRSSASVAAGTLAPLLADNVSKWIDPNFSLFEVLVANSMWRSHLKNLWRILCESYSTSNLHSLNRLIACHAFGH
jgi:hypothetical protein